MGPVAKAAAVGPVIIGQSPAFVSAFMLAARVARARAAVLIQGETGTGKELLARLVHNVSPRASRPFLAVNCAAIPEALLESELFGHERGAFTGAVQRHIGRFERASGGTLFLDEVADMSPAMQAKILRVLQEREIERVGCARPTPVDTRVIAATNRDLKREVADGSFREDLYYRIVVVTISLPPLRERGSDIRLLAEYYLQRFAAEYDRPDCYLAEAAHAALLDCSWPGNIRQLRNVIERAVLVCDGDRILPEHLVLDGAETDPAAPVPGGHPPECAHGLLPLDELERRHISRALQLTGGRLGRAAEMLGIHRNTLRRKLQAYDLEPEIP